MSKLFYKEENNKKSMLFDSWKFKKSNYIIFLTGLALIFLGYIIMATGSVNSFQSLTIAPILLFSGYIIFIPLSILYKKQLNTYEGSQFSWLERRPVKPEVEGSSPFGPAPRRHTICLSRNASLNCGAFLFHTLSTIFILYLKRYT